MSTYVTKISHCTRKILKTVDTCINRVHRIWKGYTKRWETPFLPHCNTVNHHL